MTSSDCRRGAGVGAALALIVGCVFPDVQVRKRAADDFGCPEDQVAVHHVPSGYLARGCRKEADYSVKDGQVTRNSEIRNAVEERPSVPIDSTADGKDRCSSARSQKAFASRSMDPLTSSSSTALATTKEQILKGKAEADRASLR